MNEILPLMIFFLAGAGLGMIYFGGLWWTVRKIVRSRQPHLLALGSFVLRSGLCLAGLYGIARGGSWEHLVVSLLGLLVVRWALIQLGSPHKGEQRSLSRG